MKDNKILISLVVPAVSESFNVLIPISKTIAETIMILNQAINDLTEGEFPISKNLSLVNCNTGEVYNYDYTVHICKIEYGSTLALY